MPSVIGVFVSPCAGPPIVLKDVALPTLTVVAAHGVDADMCTESGIAGGTFIDIQTVRSLPLLVSLAVISVSRVARAQHTAEVIRALLFTGSLGTNVIIFWNTLSKNKFISFAAFFPEARGELARRLQTWVFGRGDLVFRAHFSKGGKMSERKLR